MTSPLNYSPNVSLFSKQRIYFHMHIILPTESRNSRHVRDPNHSILWVSCTAHFTATRMIPSIYKKGRNSAHWEDGRALQFKFHFSLTSLCSQTRALSEHFISKHLSPPSRPPKNGGNNKPCFHILHIYRSIHATDLSVGVPPAPSTPVGSLLQLTLPLFCRIASAPNI